MRDTAHDPAAPRRALIVAHGQPSDPGPAEAALARFADRVAAELPGGWQVASATLAAPGALEAALAGAGAGGPGAGPLLIYPMFIADGWFTRVNLPARLHAAGLGLVASAGGAAMPAAAAPGLGSRDEDDPALAGARGPEAGALHQAGKAHAAPGHTGAATGHVAQDRGTEETGAGQLGAGVVGAGDMDPEDMGGEDRSGEDRSAGPDGPGEPGPGAAEGFARPGAAAGQGRARILAPFGLDPGILPLALQVLAAALAEAGLRAAETRLILAAHGSFKSPAPAAVARRLGRAIIAEMPFAELRTAFIDQAPRIADSARELRAPALCLPLFAAAGGHVEEDLPAALAEAGFAGRILAPLGLAAGAPRLVAAALSEAGSEAGAGAGAAAETAAETAAGAGARPAP